jgi:colicin import membrane protein
VAGKFDQADKALADAKKFAPQDPTVIQAAKDLDEARTTAATEATNKQKAKLLLAEAQAALKAGQLDAANKAVADARKLTPQDPSLLQTIKDVDQARAMMTKETDQKRKLDTYKKAMDTGRQAITGKKYEDAITAFTEAGKAMPGDKEAADQLSLAKSKAKEMAAEVSTQKQLQKALGDFQTALKAGHLDQAGKALVDAKKLAPQDPDVIQGAKDLEAARALVANEAMKKQKMADYQRAMKSGRDALTVKKYDDAIKSFTEAGSLLPGDKDALALLKQTEKAKADAKTAADPDAKKKADFTRLMDQAQKLVNARRYSDAMNAYQDALDLMPDSAPAKAGLQKAKKASETVKPTGGAAPAEYTRQMQLGAALDKQQRYADAVKAYATALKAVPNDAKASSAQSFSQHMADGIKLFSARKFADAAKDFDEALKINADDATAKALSKRAKDGR